MKKSFYHRTSNKALKLLYILVPYFLFCAASMAETSTHKIIDGSFFIADPAGSSPLSPFSIEQKVTLAQDTILNSVAGNSYFSFAYTFQRNSYPNYIPLKAKASDPTIDCPGNFSTNTDPGLCKATISLPLPTINDSDGDITTLTWKISGANIALSPVTGINYVPVPYTFDKGITTITYIVTDGLGSQATCSYTVTVKDTEAPTLVCPDDANINISSCAKLTDTIFFALKEFKDNCGLLNYTNNAPLQFSLGTTTVLWTGKDISGNSSQCVQKVNVTSDSPLNGVITNQTNVKCKGSSTGSVTVAGNGGSAPYQYKLNGGTFQVSGTFNSLIAGTYTITVKDVYNCESTVAVTITESATALTAAITSQTSVTCAGQANATATVNANGGTAPYTYSWNTIPEQTTATAIKLKAQSYEVTVTDSFGCTVSVSTTITQPAPLVVTFSKTDVSCFGDSTGTATALTSGGNPPYTYAWLTVPIQNTASITNLWAERYTLLVVDSLGCFKAAAVIVNQPASKFLASITNKGDVACSGSATGSLTVAGSGGVLPYQYNIDGGTFQVSGIFNNLAEGTHTIVAKDANDCNVTTTATITGPALPLAAIISNFTNVLCSGQANGTATVAASGGTSPYTYSWNTTPVQTTATATNLAGGTYTVTVTDAAFCETSAKVTITVPTSIIVTTSTTEVSCFGGSNGTATAIPSGGVPPYTYAWVTIPVQNTATATNLPVGTYTVAAIDASGCFKTASVTITQPATQLSASYTQVNVVCAGNNGSVTVTGSGGIPPYQYKINGGAFQPSGTFNNLSAGAHNITVMDANNCTFNLTATITEPANALHASITGQINVLCKGQANGSATITATDGIPPYSFTWQTTPVQTTATITNLTIGNYVVTTTDNTGCSVIDTAFITEPALDLSVSVINQVDYDCATGINGSVTVAGAGGTPNYEYSLDGGSFQANSTFTNLPVGGYTLTIRDNNNCEATVSVQIIVGGLILAFDDNFTIPEDIVLNANVMLNDRVKCLVPITVTSNTSPQHGTLIINSDGSFTYTPAPDYNGSDSFDYTITDDVGASSTATVSITIDPVNDPPVLLSEHINVNYNLPSSGNILLNGNYDPEGTDLNVTTTPILDASHGTFVIAADGSFTYTPDLDYIGNDIVIVNVCDEGLPLPPACSTDTLYFVVLAPNRPPVTLNEYINACQNSIFTGTASNGGNLFNGDSDPENNLPLTLNSVPVQDAAHGTFTITDVTTGTFNYEPNKGFTGSDIVIVSICDSGIPVECSNDTIFIIVNEAIVANAGDDQTILPGSIASLTGSATGGSGIYSWDWVPASLTVNPSSQNTETIILSSEVPFILTVMDITTGCNDTDTTTVIINNTDYTPLAVADYDTTLLNTPITINIIENDIIPSGDPLIVSFCSAPTNGIVVLNSDKTITYTPSPDFNGDDMFCYSICNEYFPWLCSETSVYIHVKKPTINDLYPYSGISPNGDGNNDVWKIKNIDKYPDNTVIIFNRWGDKLREFANYNNTDRSWDGRNEKGEFLPDGTYFYILDVKDVGVLKGWIYLRGTH